MHSRRSQPHGVFPPPDSAAGWPTAKAIIVDKLGVDEAEVKPEASFTNDLGA